MRTNPPLTPGAALGDVAGTIAALRTCSPWYTIGGLPARHRPALNVRIHAGIRSASAALTGPMSIQSESMPSSHPSG